jgi:transcriptional regulator with XRE-family HTH domain
VASIKDDLGAYLREQRQGAKLTLRQLAELAEVSNPYLSQIERGLKKPSAEILQSLAKGLRVSAESLYVRAGILEERDEQQVDIEAAILSDSLLSERQKRVLLDIYESFRAENARSAAEVDEITGSGAPTGKPPVRQRAAKKAAAKAAAKTAKKTATKATKRAATKAGRGTSAATARTTRAAASGIHQPTSTTDTRSDS